MSQIPGRAAPAVLGCPLRVGAVPGLAAWLLPNKLESRIARAFLYGAPLVDDHFSFGNNEVPQSMRLGAQRYERLTQVAKLVGKQIADSRVLKLIQQMPGHTFG
jgi:hypothetical protein